LSPDIQYLMLYLLTGCFVGFFAGLLGIGGGSVMVPILSMIFAARGYGADHVVHMALATSMATIIPGALMSARTHHQHKAVEWDILKQMLPGILVGTFCGAVIAHFSSTAFLKGFFVAFICFLAIQMLFDFSSKLLKHRAAQIPGANGLFIFGAVMGVVSSFAGIGGAVLSIAFLMWCGLTMHRAIGTASAIGVPLAIAGTLGFIVTGLTDNTMPAWSLGYVYLPAFAAIAATSMFLAPVGARLAHRLPVKTLKKIFVVFLILLASKMVVSV
jgi:uncharacterized protein